MPGLRSRHPACSLATLVLVFICTLKADTPVAPKSADATVIWKMENPAEVGGHATKVYGVPEVATEAGAKTLVFNGRSDGLLVPVNPVAGWSQFTIEVLLKPDGTGEKEQRFMHIQDSREGRIMLETRVTKDSQWALDTFLFTDKEHNRPLLDQTLVHPTGQWHWIALVYDGKKMANFIDGVKELEGEVALSPLLAGRISIGVRQNLAYWYKGAIREIRFHPVALAPSALQRVTAK
jgi:hypothetical protein